MCGDVPIRGVISELPRITLAGSYTTTRFYFTYSTKQPIIKWSGSKRSQIDSILSYFPKEQINTYYEPFVGGGSILYGVLKNRLCERVVASDLCSSLIDLWNTIIFSPDSILFSYTQLWNRLQKEGQQVYYEVC